MQNMIIQAILNGNTDRASIKRSCKGHALATRVDAQISALLFAGKIISINGALRVAR